MDSHGIAVVRQRRKDMLRDIEKLHGAGLWFVVGETFSTRWSGVRIPLSSPRMDWGWASVGTPEKLSPDNSGQIRTPDNFRFVSPRKVVT